MDMSLTASAALTSAGPLTQAAPASGKKDPLRAKAEQLEGVFLNTLVGQMFSSLDDKGMFSGGYATKTWRSIEAEQYSAKLAAGGGVGLADDIMKSLLEVQQAASAASPSNPTGVTTS